MHGIHGSNVAGNTTGAIKGEKPDTEEAGGEAHTSERGPPPSIMHTQKTEMHAPIVKKNLDHVGTFRSGRGSSVGERCRGKKRQSTKSNLN